MTEKISLRMAAAADAAELLNIYSYYVEETNITFEYEVPTLADFQSRITTILEKYPYIVAEKENKIIGYAYANVFKGRAAYDWTVESSIYLDVSTVGKGLGDLLYTKLEEILIQQNITTIEACITYPNDRSIAFHKRRGYEQVAYFNKVGYKFDKWHDVVWYEKKLAEQTSRPEKVNWLPEIEIKF